MSPVSLIRKSLYNRFLTLFINEPFHCLYIWQFHWLVMLFLIPSFYRHIKIKQSSLITFTLQYILSILDSQMFHTLSLTHTVRKTNFNYLLASHLKKIVTKFAHFHLLIDLVMFTAFLNF